MPYPRATTSAGNCDVLITDSAGVDCMETVVPSSQISSASFFTETQRQFSRYYNEFEELKLLGKGAFGAVIKVRYKNYFPLLNPFWNAFVSSEAEQCTQHLLGFVDDFLVCCACIMFVLSGIEQADKFC